MGGESSCCCAAGKCLEKSCKNDLKGGRADKKRPEDFDQVALKEGTQHELEHTDSEGMAREIAMDHLSEDSEYYTRLKQIEKSLEGLPDLTFSSLVKGRKLARRMKLHGLDVSIETDKGQNRHWYDPNAEGEKGVTKMKYPYGYIRRTMGADDECVDVYVGPNKDSKRVFVIRQMKKPDFTKYDECKVMMGFETPKEAKQAYLTHYNSPKFFGSMKEMDVDSFKEKFVSKNLDAAPVPENNIPNELNMLPGPPPIDVETLEGVEHLLGRVGEVNDNELMQIASEIWGPGFQFENTSPQQAREEVVGFLHDQRDLLFHAPLVLSPVNMPREPQGSTDFSRTN